MRERRLAFFARRHRHGPGVDWVKRDQETRRIFRNKRQLLIKELRVSGKLGDRESMIELIGGETGKEHGFPNRGLLVPGMGRPPDPMLEGRWVERGSDNQAGRMLTADVSADGTIFAASDGGIIWASSELGNDWRCLNDHFRFDGIKMLRVVADAPGEKLLVLDEYDFYSSDHLGLSWSPSLQGLETVQDWGALRGGIVVNDKSHTVYVHAIEWDYRANEVQTTVYRSEDLGRTFQLVFSKPGDRLIDLWTSSPGRSGEYLLVGDEFYRLDDTGATRLGTLPFSFNHRVLDTENGAHLAGSETQGEFQLYAAIPVFEGSGTGAGTHVFGSSDGGDSWEVRSFVASKPFATNSFACSFEDPSKVYLGASCDLLYQSADNGRTWTVPDYHWWEYYLDPLNKLHCDIPGINIFEDSGGAEYALVHTDGGTYISRDGMETVTNLSLSGLRISQYYSTYTHQIRPDIIFAGSQDQGFQRSFPGQNSRILDFEQIISGDDGQIVSSDGGDTVWWVHPGILSLLKNARTSDYVELFGLEQMMRGGLWLPPLMADPEDPYSVFVGGGQNHDGSSHASIFRVSYDQYQFSWESLPSPFSGTITAITSSPIDSDTRYVMTDVGGSGDFYWSRTGGQSWNQSPLSEFAGNYLFGTAVAPCPVQLGRVYIAGSGYSNPPVFVSDDHGQTFRRFDDGLPGTLVNQLAISSDGSFLFAATDVGPFVRRTDFGRWEHLGGIFGPDQAYFSVEYVHQTARFGTYGRGIWDFKIGPLTRTVGGRHGHR